MNKNLLALASMYAIGSMIPDIETSYNSRGSASYSKTPLNKKQKKSRAKSKKAKLSRRK